MGRRWSRRLGAHEVHGSRDVGFQRHEEQAAEADA
jgi:hypothetical protein